MRITSPRKAAAARRNGRLSRGPVTPAGKARCARNGLKHGFYAQTHTPAFYQLLHDAAQVDPSPDKVFDALWSEYHFWTAWRHHIARLVREAALVLPRMLKAVTALQRYVKDRVIPARLLHLLTPEQAEEHNRKMARRARCAPRNPSRAPRFHPPVPNMAALFRKYAFFDTRPITALKSIGSNPQPAANFVSCASCAPANSPNGSPPPRPLHGILWGAS